MSHHRRQPMQHTLPWDPETVSTAEAASILRCGYTTIQRYVQEGRLEGFKRRRRPNSPLRIVKESVDRMRAQMPTDTRKTITVQRAAKLLGVSKKSVIAYIRDGDLEAFKGKGYHMSEYLIIYESCVAITHRWREMSGVPADHVPPAAAAPIAPRESQPAPVAG